ncbi:MAG TPA: urea ABC transporter permease subunit UrtB [Polyangiaceae bacterium]|nr:urea ABC transporter permease subunit UrtB [Polyangiaceae bacterium]
MNQAFRALSVFAFVLITLFGRPARAAGELEHDLKSLLSSDSSDIEKAVDRIAARHDAVAVRALGALLDGTLRLDPDGLPYAATETSGLTPLVDGAPKQAKTPLATPVVDNQLRRQLQPVLASLKLTSSDRDIRLAAADDLSKHRDDDLAPLVRKALVSEKDAKVRQKLALALAMVDLPGTDKKARLAAIAAIESAADANFKPELQRVLAKDEKGGFREPDAEIRKAASSALGAIETRAVLYGFVGNLFYGLSLGSVLLLTALGLAITFGLMRVINMAHGELLMIGAYATYVVQNFFQQHFPAYFDFYILCAVPVAFVASAAVGLLLERTVLRFLYGRPLETLLATFGISLMLIQTVRLLFGAQNVTVRNPQWLSGGVELLPGFVLTYSRVAVILFSGVVVAFVWFMLQKTPLGLHVRAVTQNRDMAAGMGISTRRVDSWTFAIGSGVAGLGGVALSQLGNVGPELGQTYIVDSFMVVVLGGVGKLAGTLAGALGLGLVNKLLEPVAGAVLGKIAILVFIILFIQRRPQGIFALKGRAAEVT